MKYPLVCAALTVMLAGPALAAPAPLPAPDGRVDTDPGNAGRPDIAGGTTTAGAPAVPWAIFEKTNGAGRDVVVRALLDGQWVPQGPALNVTAGSVAEGPAIDFAGAGRTVPWATWYEPHGGFAGAKQIFASRFAKGTNTWVPAGQARVSGPDVPSLNLHTGRDAENPAIAGGAAEPGTDPEPWVAWQEISNNAGAKNQIFVSKGVKQVSDSVKCTGFTPGGGDLTALGGFCWQQVGIKRLPTVSTPDPSLNVDIARDAVEPDVAFTGPNDKVAWVVWYEEGAPTAGLAGNKLVFAAKAVADPAADGGFRWVVEGNTGDGVLDTSGGNTMGPCAASAATVRACSLNAVSTRDAENIRVTAGTQTPGTPTVPWVVWQENTGVNNEIFVSRLVGDRFELFNGGLPVSNPDRNATRPDITFSGNVPYISWIEKVGTQERAFVGHFEGAKFVLDTPVGVLRGPAGLIPDTRAPITSTCTANPFNADGAACQGAAAGSPAYLYAEASPNVGITDKVFAEGFGPVSVVTGPSSKLQQTTAEVSVTVNGGGGPANVVVEFGTTTAYGSRTTPLRVQPGQPTTVAVNLTGLPAGTVIHYRAVASGDFGSVTGADATFTTTAAPAPTPSPAPNTSITKAPKKRVVTRAKKATVKVRFASDVPGSRFVCRVKPSARFKACTSPKTLRLRPGKYQFAVRATAPDGQVDATPATKRFTVIRRR
jgi:hypothetical protein